MQVEQYMPTRWYSLMETSGAWNGVRRAWESDVLSPAAKSSVIWERQANSSATFWSIPGTVPVKLPEYQNSVAGAKFWLVKSTEMAPESAGMTRIWQEYVHHKDLTSMCALMCLGAWSKLSLVKMMTFSLLQLILIWWKMKMSLT